MKLPELARLSIEHFLRTGQYLDICNVPEIPRDFIDRQAGTFVSLHQKNGELRGCVGTFIPTQKSIAVEVVHNAVSAAVGDSRFYPVRLEEVPELMISVDVLSKPEKVKDRLELDPQKYGVILSAQDGRRGLLLPDLEGVETVEEQLRIACAKAAIDTEEDFQIERFEVIRYS